MLAELGPGPRPAAGGRAHAAGGLALPPLRGAGLHAGPRAAARASRSWCSRAPTSSARSWPREGGFIVPEQAIDAQSLVAFADLVISAGGTMNREAVALGTPVWTTFEGRLGAVDERADRRGPPAPADQRRGRRVRAPATRGEPPAAHPPRPGGVHRSVREGRLGGRSVRAGSPNTLPRMRRRLRTAAFPIHRHALPQVALDAGLVALAYYLAYRLRFDGGIPARYLDLFGARSRSRSSARSSASRWSACTGTGCATRRSASTSRSPRASCSRVLALVGYVARRPAAADLDRRAASSRCTSRPACSCSSACCRARS